MSKPPVPVCPQCSRVATMRKTEWGERFDCCGLWAWGRYPLADRATHAARQAAHAAFDPLWRQHGLTRHAAYKALAEELGIQRRDCHMKLMDLATAERVPEIAKRILLQARGLVA